MKKALPAKRQCRICKIEKKFLHGAQGCCGRCMDGLAALGNNIMNLKRAILVLKNYGKEQEGDAIVHGVDCGKDTHTSTVHYLHGEHDDLPYSVGNGTYCGRCHYFFKSILNR